MDGCRIEQHVVSRGFDGERFWGQARVGALPAEGDRPLTALVTAQPALRSGSDVFFELHEWTSPDRGASWSGPRDRGEALGRRVEADGRACAICGMEPDWHAASGRLLSTGHSVWYADDRHPVHNGPIDVCYSAYDPDAASWRPWEALALPEEPEFFRAAGGCSQRVELEDGTILLPIHCRPRPAAGGENPRKTAWSACNAATVLRCSFDGRTLRYLEHGPLLRLEEPRGYCEPSLVRHGERFYLTLRNDQRGYVAVGEDGLHFAEPKPWRFDDGAELGNANTQQHWISRREGLFLVYTRRGLENDHVFRHRAPLLMAEVDPERCVVLRETERELVPNRGARLGNFSVCHATEDETWVVVSEWMQPEGCEEYGSDNSIWFVRVLGES